MKYNAEDFFDLSQDLFCIVGTDGCFKKANKAFQKLVGFSNDELTTLPASTFIYADDIPSFIKICSVTDCVNNLNIRFTCKDGSSKSLSWSGTKVSGQPYIYTSVLDVSKQKDIDLQLSRAVNASLHLLNSSPDVIGTISSTGIFLSLNTSSEELWGFTPAELIGTHWKDIICPEDIEITYKMASELFAGASLTNFENRYIHKSGKIIPIIWSVRWSEEDSMIYFVARNAMERKKQEEQILFNERRFRGLVQSGSDMIAIIDKDGIYQYVSPTITAILGYAPEFLTGKAPLGFIHNDDKGKVESALLMAFQQYKIEPEIFRFINANGEWRCLKVVITNMLMDNSINGIVVNARDVTEQLAIENQKAQAIKRLNNLIENYTQGYFSLDKDWIIREVNPATLRLLDLPREQLIDRAISDLFPKSNGASFYDEYEKAINENVFVEFEERMVSSNRWFLVSAYPYEENLTVFFKEITQEKLQKLLVNLEKNVLEINTIVGSSLKETVDHYLKGISEIYRVKCFLSLHDKERDLLFPFSAPGLPAEYLDSLTAGFLIDPEGGSCGPAAYFKDNFVIENIALHSNTEKDKDVFSAHNLLSCWSTPIIDNQKELIGTLAIYHDSVGAPDETEYELIKRVTAFLNLLIESHQTRERLLISNQRYKYITYATNDAIYDWNIESGQIDWGEGAAKLFGYNERKSTISSWKARLHHSECQKITDSLQQAIDDKTRSYWHAEYRYKRSDGSYAYVIEDGYIIRDTHNMPLRMVGALKDISKLKESALKILKQNRRLQEIATINSHHIRKPLANILGLIEAIKVADEAHIQELIGLLDTSGTELDSIVRKIAKKTLV